MTFPLLAVNTRGPCGAQVLLASLRNLPTNPTIASVSRLQYLSRSSRNCACSYTDMPSPSSIIRAISALAS